MSSEKDWKLPILRNDTRSPEDKAAYWARPGTALYNELLRDDLDVFSKLSLIHHKKYERVKAGNFLGNPVRILYVNDGSVNERGSLYMNGNTYSSYSRDYLQDVEDTVDDREDAYQKTDSREAMKRVSDSMELIFSDLMHLMFPGFEIVLPHKIDDLQGVDVLLVKKDKDGRVICAFSLDMSASRRKPPHEVLERKLASRIYRAKEGKLGFVNLVETVDKVVPAGNGKTRVTKQYYSARNVPNFVLPIDMRFLREIAEEYYDGNIEAFENVCGELREIVLRQLDFQLDHANDNTRGSLERVADMFASTKRTSRFRNTTSNSVIAYLRRLEDPKAFQRFINEYNKDHVDE
jgi:hypothetical protein